MRLSFWERLALRWRKSKNLRECISMADGMGMLPGWQRDNYIIGQMDLRHYDFDHGGAASIGAAERLDLYSVKGEA